MPDTDVYNSDSVPLFCDVETTVQTKVDGILRTLHQAADSNSKAGVNDEMIMVLRLTTSADN